MDAALDAISVACFVWGIWFSYLGLVCGGSSTLAHVVKLLVLFLFILGFVLLTIGFIRDIKKLL